MIGIPGHFRTQFPLSASGKPAVGLFLRRRPLYPTELRAQIRYNPRQGRPNTYRLGGGRSILLSYGCRCMGYYTTLVSVVQAEKAREFPVVPDAGNLLFTHGFILHFS